MIPLDSPRWSELKQAYGPATAVPALLRAIANEPVPRYSKHPEDARNNPTPWDQVYSTLCHQYSIYSATYAAFPHLVAIAEAGGLEKRVETLIFAGVICVTGIPARDIPSDLFDECEIAMRKVRQWSLATVRAAKLDDRSSLPYLLQAFGGLRHPKSIYVRCIDRLHDGHGEFESDDCPNCSQHFFVQMTADGPVTVPCDDRGMTIEQRAKKLPVNRSNYTTLIERGHAILQQSDDPAWPEPETGNVLAALAHERGATDLSIRILDIDSTIICPHCDGLIRPADAFDY